MLAQSAVDWREVRMRSRVIVLIAAAGLTAAGLASAMTVPRLKGTLTDAAVSLKTAKGKTVRTLTAGRYTFVVKDAAVIHNFTLNGPGIKNKTITGTGFTGTKSVTVKLRKGTYLFYCTIHPTTIRGAFKVK
jgi:plastocyanin